MKNKIAIREVSIEDYVSIAQLSKELGYDIKFKSVQIQMNLILRNPNHFVFVATKNKNVVGYIHCFVSLNLTAPAFIEIAALVVSEEERSQGIGKLLVQKAETICSDSQKLRVRCNIKRKLAHQFYYNLNFKFHNILL